MRSNTRAAAMYDTCTGIASGSGLRVLDSLIDTEGRQLNIAQVTERTDSHQLEGFTKVGVASEICLRTPLSQFLDPPLHAPT